MTEVEEKVKVGNDVEVKADGLVDNQTTIESQDSKNGDHKKERRGILSDASVLPSSTNHAEIRKQVEFYFTDSNLRFDKYLFSLVGFENNWVGIDMIAKFNRMLRFPFPEIVKAMETSELLELNEDKTQMRRKEALQPPVKEQYVDRSASRSIYAKGFGVEKSTTQFDIEAFFEQTGLKVNAVRLRRDNDKIFKGSVFVEFKNDDEMEKFMALEEKPKWNGEEAKEFVQPVYDDAKKEEKTEEATSEDAVPEVKEEHIAKPILEEDLPTEEKAAKEATQGVRYMRKKEFTDMKLADIQAGRIKAKPASEQKFDAFKGNGNHSGGYRGRGNGNFRGRGRGGDGGYKSHNNNRDRDDRRGGSHRDRDGGDKPKHDDRDWKSRREDDRKNGFKDDRGSRDGRDGGDRRGGRDNHRGGRDRDNRSSNKRDVSPGPKDRDGNGIPKLRTSDPLPPRLTAHLGSGAKTSDKMDAAPTNAVESKAAGVPKRAHEDDGAGGSPKKSKVDGEI